MFVQRLTYHIIILMVQEIGRLTEEEDGPPPFRRVFRASDQRDTGTLPPLAFRRCLLEELGFDLTEDECETLLDYLVRTCATRLLRTTALAREPSPQLES